MKENAMDVFVTGASGWIGSAVTRQLIESGHRVSGLVRSDDGAAAVGAAGATPVRGDLDDLDLLARSARAADAVVHLANKHDWANPAESNRAERAAVQTFVDALDGSGAPFLFASGVAGLTPGRPSTEADANPSHGPDAPRGGAENLALEAADRGLVPVALRFAPSVHGMGDHGFVRLIADAARRSGVASYVGSGEHGWATVHRSDAARLVALVLEHPDAAQGIVHAVAEPDVPTRAIAEALAARDGLPVESVEPDVAVERLGFIGTFFARPLTATAELTRARYGWITTGPTLLDDIAAGAYDAG
jgi:nucleoside-diphosphate-sugar epimerase